MLLDYIKQMDTSVPNTELGEGISINQERMMDLLYRSPCLCCDQVSGANYLLRLDNEREYSEENVIPVCPECFAICLERKLFSVKELQASMGE